MGASPIGRLPRDARPSKIDLVEREVIEMIASGELGPGDFLQQRAIAARVGVSPTPVREAFRRLEVAGVLVNRNGRGPQVAEPQGGEDANTVPAALDRVGIEMAVRRATPEDIAELRALNHLHTTAAGAEREEVHRRLHFKIVEMSGSQILMTQMQVLWRAVSTTTVARRDPEGSVRQHGNLVEAIAAGDVERARAIVDEHYGLQRRHD